MATFWTGLCGYKRCSWYKNPAIEVYCVIFSLLQRKSREESSGHDSGVEILINEPYMDGPGGNGQYTHKIYHIGSHLPGKTCTWEYSHMHSNMLVSLLFHNDDDIDVMIVVIWHWLRIANQNIKHNLNYINHLID